MLLVYSVASTGIYCINNRTEMTSWLVVSFAVLSDINHWMRPQCLGMHVDMNFPDSSSI